MRRICLKFILVPLVLSSLTACGGLGAKPQATVGDMPSHGPVGRTLKAHSDRFAICGRESVSVQTGTPQHLQLNFIVQPDGHVVRPQITAMTAPDPDLYDCVRHVLRELVFPKPKDGKPKTVTYPLVLKPME